MIWTALMSVLMSFATHVLDLLPTYTTSLSDSGGALGYFFGFIRATSGWVNLTLLLGVIALAAAVELGVQIARFVLWVYHQIPLNG
jgi:hypothetical protein